MVNNEYRLGMLHTGRDLDAEPEQLREIRELLALWTATDYAVVEHDSFVDALNYDPKFIDMLEVS